MSEKTSISAVCLEAVAATDAPAADLKAAQQEPALELEPESEPAETM
eukprot:COSAG06_NODE_3456_length_5315_cov_3.740414_7_plen_47_part_00